MKNFLLDEFNDSADGGHLIPSVDACGSSAMRFFPQAVNWTAVTAVSRSTATLQVVINPIFNPATTPIAPQAWETLASLNATHVRFAAWFPYPQWGVPEPFPPVFSPNGTCTTSWNFDGLMTQLNPFLESVHTAVLDISTLPEWLFADPTGFTTNATSNVADWSYTSSGTWMPNSTEQAGEYYGRVAAYLLNGEMIDECGGKHHHKKNGVPAPVVKRDGLVWEVFNEPEYEMRGCGPERYVATFDEIVMRVRETADPNHIVKFQGLALQYHGEWNWWTAFLTPGNHVPEARDAVNFASFHFYSVLSHRVDNSTWQWELFDPVDDFETECKAIVELRNTLSPHTKLNTDECGSILPNDNNPASPIPSDLYFVASASMYAYLFAKLTVVGVDVIGESQLAGSPTQPQYQIFDAQYPSVSMLNWTNGHGNARFHILQLILAEFAVGDVVHAVHLPPRATMCRAIWNNNQLGLNYDKAVVLSCPSGSVIESIVEAHAGHILGDCDHGFDVRSALCIDNGTVANFVQHRCVGQQSCSVDMTSLASQTNCFSKGAVRIVIQATCSKNTSGFAVPSAYIDDRVFVQSRTSSKTGKRQLLAVNKNNHWASVVVDTVLEGCTALVLDENNAMPKRIVNISGNSLPLAPFASAIITFP